MLPVLLIGSLGFLMVALIDGYDDGGNNSEEEENEIPETAIERTVENAVVNSIFDHGASSEIEMLEDYEGNNSFPQDPSSANLGEGNVSDVNHLTGQKTLLIDSTSLGSEDTSSPLDDFNSNINAKIIHLDEIDYISVDIDPELGRVGVLRADYYERYDDENGLEAESLHAGINLYFIPEGEIYPGDYVWSDDGASLYNYESNSNDPADFGDIRLILRVDTGTLYDAGSYEAAQNFSDEMFDRVQPIIIGEGIRFEI